jgi:hypothetical protein
MVPLFSHQLLEAVLDVSYMHSGRVVPRVLRSGMSLGFGCALPRSM